MYSISNSDLQTFDCTVVICTRNRPGHLRRCIEELQKQTFRAFEILVVDNSSKPSDAWHIAASYGTRYLLCPTIGLSHARNGLGGQRSVERQHPPAGDIVDGAAEFHRDGAVATR